MKKILAILAMCAPVLAGTRMVTNATQSVDWTTGVSYTYDSSGNLRRIGNDTFVYDDTGRLVAASVNGSERDYEYDAFGNRTKCTIATCGDCQYGVQIQPGNNRINGAGYDGAGNVQTFDGHSYSYDAVNMTTRDVRPATGVAREYIYTADDERIATYNVGSSWNWTVRDATGKVLREFTSSDGPQGRGTASWNWVRDDVWRDGQLLASRQFVSNAITTYHYHLDHLGTPRRVTDQNDTTVGTHDYHAFGPAVSGGVNEPGATTLKYTDHERDIWSDDASLDTLDYMHARYYNPALGRFLSIDAHPGSPDAPQSWNRYAYARNTPLRMLDLDGNVEVEFKIRHFIPMASVQLPHGRNVGDARSFSLNPHASVRTERTIRIETDPVKNPSGIVAIEPPRIGESHNLWFDSRGRANGDSMTAEVKRIPGFGVLITTTQNEPEPLNASFGLPQTAQFFTGMGGIRSTVNIIVSEDGKQIDVFGERSSFPAMEINATEGNQTFSVFRGNASTVPLGFGIFGTLPIDTECTAIDKFFQCH